MIEKAIEKLKAEMEANKDNECIQMIGMFLLNQIEINKSAAETIMKGGKTIKGSYEEMGKIAKKEYSKIKNKKGYIGIGPSKAIKIIAEYFGFEAVQNEMLGVKIHDIKEQYNITNNNQTPSKRKRFTAKLDDFLK